MIINKVLIPAAGLGTRFLPFTKAVPKELLPLMNKPAIHYIIEEILSAGIQEIGIITNDDKPALKHYLSGENKRALPFLDCFGKAHFSYISQPEPKGLGHAILQAEEFIGGQSCAIILPDDIVFGPLSEIKTLIECAQREQVSVLAVQEVSEQAVSSYGIIEIQEQISESLFRVKHIIEKPSIDQAPSRLAIVGRYVVSPALFTSLKAIDPSSQGELQLSDALAHMINSGNHKILALKIEGERHDVGTPCGWLKAAIACALKDSLISHDMLTFMQKQLQQKMGE